LRTLEKGIIVEPSVPRAGTHRFPGRLLAGLPVPALLAAAFLGACGSTPPLPSDPEYAPQESRTTAALARASETSDKVSALTGLLRAKVLRMEELGGKPAPLLEAVCRSYVLLLEKGLLAILKKAFEDEADVRTAARTSRTALAEQLRALENLHQEGGAAGPGEAAKRTREAIDRIRAWAGEKGD
jgi:hypothetical protein